MARLFTSGFELNSITDGVEFTSNNATVQIVTTNARSGTYHGRVSGSSNGFWRQNVFTSDQGTVGYIGIGICIHSAVNASSQLVRWSTVGNVSVGNITLKSDNTLVLLKSNGVQIGSASAALSLDTYYYVEFKNDATAATGTLEARLNGSVFATGLNSNKGSFARALVGLVTGVQTTADIYFDDWKINDNSGSSQTSYPGDGKIIILRPDSAGDANAWLQTAGGAGSSTNYTLTNETTPDDATSMVQTGTLNNEDFYNMGASGIQSYDTVNLVQVGARFRNDVADATTAFKLEIEKTASGTISQSAAIIPNSTTWRTNTISAPDTYPLTLYTDPDGAAWTNTTLDSMQLGAKLTAANVNKIQLSTIWAYIDYTPGTPPAGGNSNFFAFF